MSMSLKWRAAIVAAVTVLGIVFLLPSLMGSDANLPGFLAERKLHLGLDLQGGMHLVLEVQAEKAVEQAVERMAAELKAALREARIRARAVEAQGKTIRLVLRDAEAADRLQALLDDDYPMLRPVARAEEGGRVVVKLGLDPAEAKRLEKYAVDQAIETIRNRVDQFGVTEPTIVPQGERRILIQLPGIKDPERAIRLIGKTAQLEFRLLAEDVSVDEALKNGPPPGTEILYEHEVDPVTRQVVGRRPLVVQKRVLMGGDVITDARVQIDQRYNEPYVTLNFDKRGARMFERITAENVGKRLAIVLDGVVQSAPVIRERISGGPDHGSVQPGGGPGPGDRPAVGEPARTGQDPGAAHGGALPGARLDPGRPDVPRDRRCPGGAVHGVLLQVGRGGGGSRARHERGADPGGSGPV